MKRNANRLLLVALLLLKLLSFVDAQQDNTFFFMHAVPQSNLLNPAVQIPCKIFIGFPGLSSTHLNINNTGFSYNDLFQYQPSNDSLYLRANNILKKAHNIDYFSAEFHLNLISIGYMYNEYYFTFNISEKADMYLFYPRTLLKLALEGNKQFEGQIAKFSSLRANASYYREYALGVSKVIDERLTIGIRAKLLFGKLNAYTGRSSGSLYTDALTRDLSAKSFINGHISAPVNFQTDSTGKLKDATWQDVSAMSVIMNSQNKGLALDFGFIYKYTDRITLSGSMIDIGFIRWKSKASNFDERGDFYFGGTGFGSSFNTADYFQEVVDSVNQQFNVAYKQHPYFSFLPSRLYLGGTYDLNNQVNVGLLTRNDFFRYKIQPSFSLSVNSRFWRFLALSLSYSEINNSFNNVGAGLGILGKNFGFHLVTDNFLAYKIKDTRNINLRFGLHFMFGCGGEKKESTQGRKFPKDNGCERLIKVNDRFPKVPVRKYP
jgi:hypothetical protein